MAFWRRKKDEFVSLGLSRAASERAPDPQTETKIESQPAPVAVIESDDDSQRSQASTPWQTSVLGLDLSIEQLQAQEAALEQELSARFRRAVAATRESLSEKIDTVFAGAKQIEAEGNDVLICAADTFRAAASDQLAIWAERTGVPLIQQKQGTDPAAVLFDSMKAAKARKSDVLIVDTVGRLHNKSNLMAELEKMKRVAAREVEGAPHETLLVVDAVTGQNGLEQARQFLKIAGVTGIVLTKLDGTAKGGIAVAIAKELNLPIRYAGIGEKVDDLVVFNAEQYVEGLFS